MDPREPEKRAAAEAAADYAEEGMTVGLGSGSTVSYFIPALARRGLDIRCVATSPQTERAASALGLAVGPWDAIDVLDLAVDGADQVAPDHWLVKGDGGAHTREKVVAAAAGTFVVIVSSDKLVDALAPPVPLEILPFGVSSTLRRIAEIGPARRREAALTPDGNILADYGGPVDDPQGLAAALDAIPGVVGHGLFAPSLVGEVLIGRPDGRVDRRSAL